jgi:N-acetyl-gamma-glutamyl-phosphate reductase
VKAAKPKGKIKAGIVNVTGYAGVELARLLSRHPEVDLVAVSGRSSAGRKLGHVFPQLEHLNLTITSELESVDFAFSALPHKESAPVVAKLIESGAKVVDISADFRLRDCALYPEWYNFTHPELPLLSEAVYGLPELYRKDIARARLVANPGCYPTSAILALAPAIKAGLISSHIIIDSKSGVSGAGRSLSLNTHYCEATDDTSAYALEGHRHLPEIEQELARFMHNARPVLTFVPHLVPMTRGILTTAYAQLSGRLEASKSGISELRMLYRDFYDDEPFVRISADPPHTKHTWGSNMCLIYPTIDVRSGRVIIISAIDNLVKGAAGQAIQNMNIMLGLPETTGLEGAAVYP